MAEVADYNVLLDDPKDLPLTLQFNLPEDLPEVHREILSWVMVDSDPNVKYSMTLNGTHIVGPVLTPPDRDPRTIQEVIEKTVPIKTGFGMAHQNTLEITNVTDHDSKITMSDIVFWYHRKSGSTIS